MKHTLLFVAFLFVACSPQTAEQTPMPHGTLRPYLTRTPSATPARPEGLIVAFETPLPSPTPSTYEVQAGDTLSGIAERFGISLDILIAANPDVSPNSMSIGTKLKIPGASANPASASTSTPVPAPVKQIVCYPTADKGLWCFVLLHNDTPDALENLSAQVMLVDASGQTISNALALSPLDILPSGASLPLMVFFPPTPSTGSPVPATQAQAGQAFPAGVQPRAQILSGIRLLPDDARYLPATIHNTLAQVDGSGRSAQVSGTVRLPDNVAPAGLVWVAAVAYDNAGRVVGVRRWESTDGIPPGGAMQFAFEVSSLGGEIERVEFVVEGRP